MVVAIRHDGIFDSLGAQYNGIGILIGHWDGMFTQKGQRGGGKEAALLQMKTISGKLGLSHNGQRG